MLEWIFKLITDLVMYCLGPSYWSRYYWPNILRWIIGGIVTVMGGWWIGQQTSTALTVAIWVFGFVLLFILHIDAGRKDRAIMSCSEDVNDKDGAGTTAKIAGGSPVSHLPADSYEVRSYKANNKILGLSILSLAIGAFDETSGKYFFWAAAALLCVMDWAKPKRKPDFGETPLPEEDTPDIFQAIGDFVMDGPSASDEKRYLWPQFTHTVIWISLIVIFLTSSYQSYMQRTHTMPVSVASIVKH